MRTRRLAARNCTIAATCLLGAALGFGAGGRVPKSLLRDATTQAFTGYVGNVESANSRSLEDGPFLWVNALGKEGQRDALTSLKSGNVEIRRLSTKANGRNPDIPGGMIHDWEGMIFIPGAKLDAVLEVLEDYNHHSAYFSPDVETSRMESHDGDHYRVFLRFRRHKVVTVVLDTEHEVNYFRDSPTRAHSRSSAIRIAQVANPGEADEKEKTPGDDDGFLWKMETWWRMEEKDGGVYVQNEAVTLTRDIPTGLGWLIEPFISNIPKETLEFTLYSLRKAVLNSSR